jgi:isocitrate/isopropylmalate dehydrogenase
MATSNYQIALLKRDGIGPEVIDAAMAVLHRASTVHGFNRMRGNPLRSGGG